MISDWVAIVGSADAHRQEELGLRNPNQAPNAASLLGFGLAERGLGLIVYSSESIFIEGSAVEGYIQNQKALPRAIRIIFPRDPSIPRPSFLGQASRPECFQLSVHPNSHWETSFFESLSEASAVILIGGGRFASRFTSAGIASGDDGSRPAVGRTIRAWRRASILAWQQN